MACWKWFNKIIDEAGIEVSEKNKGRIDEIIHRYIGKKSGYGACSADWKKARVQIQGDEKLKIELVQKLQALKAWS